VFKATSYVFDEFSAASRAIARERLASFGGRVEFDDVGETEIHSGVVFSNELFDAFPVHLVKMQASQVGELYVDVDTNGDFTWLLGAMSEDSSRVLQAFERQGIKLREGQILEVNVEIENWLRKVSAKMTKGYLVTVDYSVDTTGSTAQLGSLRGFWRHQFVEDLLARPGEHDLTTNVNWDSVKSVGMGLGLEVTQFARLDRFLLAAGCLEQLVLESQACESDAERLRLSTAAREMILPDGMASHFQVLVQRKE
jgi:SAM-dependent MidA family methyltransferase